MLGIMIARVNSILLLCLILLFVSSCSWDEEKVPTPEVEIANRALELVHNVQQSLIDDDTEKLDMLTSDTLFPRLKKSSGAIRKDELELKMRWVDILENGVVHLYISWTRHQAVSEDDDQAKGLAVFVIKEAPFILDDILREDPFEK